MNYNGIEVYNFEFNYSHFHQLSLISYRVCHSSSLYHLIDSKFKGEKVYLLAHTQGLSPTDNFEFLADYNRIKSLCFLTELASLSVLKLPAGSIQKGDLLTYQIEKTNALDKHAVKVFKGVTPVGYIKKIHSRVFHKQGNGSFKLTVKAVEQNGIIKRVFVKVAADS